MQITDEMVRVALDLQHADGTSAEDAMRAALEAALGTSTEFAKLKDGHEAMGRARCDDAACIEDLAAALKKTNARIYRLCKCDPESGCRDAALREENSATLERWGLK